MNNNRKPSSTEYVIPSERPDFVPRDLRDIKIDMSRKKPGRIRSFINQTGDPYRIKYGNAVIEMSYSNNGETLQDRIRDIYSDSHETENELNRQLDAYLAEKHAEGDRKSVVGALRKKQQIVSVRNNREHDQTMDKKRQQVL